MSEQHPEQGTRSKREGSAVDSGGLTDVVIVGGGPAGSSCAWGLRESGLQVVVIDRAEFPRDKTCAGWITPPVLSLLEIDPLDYALGRTLQPITGFRTGLLGHQAVETRYDRIVSYGIRRCEFDTFLLQRCGAVLQTGCAVKSIEIDRDHWLINGQLKARLLVGAGGNFCPVARQFAGEGRGTAPLITAQEAEFCIDELASADPATAGELPELFFCADLKGYGWSFRKGNYLNVGLGHLRPDRLKRDLRTLVAGLPGAGHGVGNGADGPALHGHAYRLLSRGTLAVPGDGVLLVGDSAGLADPRSGEGIRAAIESGLEAARTIRQAASDYRLARLAPYQQWVDKRVRTRSAREWPGFVGRVMRTAAAQVLLRSRWLTRHVLLDSWFLHQADGSK